MRFIQILMTIGIALILISVLVLTTTLAETPGPTARLTSETTTTYNVLILFGFALLVFGLISLRRK